MKALIITGGECAPNVKIPDHDFCVAADCGFVKAVTHGIFPDIIVGDFDSVDGMPDEYIDPKTGKSSDIFRHPAKKNETDTMLAVDYAVEFGATELYIIGGLGGRADHTMSNVFLLESLAEVEIPAILTDGMSELRVVCEHETVHIPHGEYKYFSTLALDNCVISVTGCAYPLKRKELHRSYAYAVSNETLEGGADVTCHTGKLLLIRSEKL